MGTHHILGLSHYFIRSLITLRAASPSAPALEILQWTIAHSGRGKTGILTVIVVNQDTVTLPIHSSCLGICKNTVGAYTHPLYQDELRVNREIQKVSDR